MQPSESTQFGANGRVHYRTNGGCPLSTFGGRIVVQMGDASATPRRAHNLVQIIVCYNYHSAKLRVRGLPKWHFGTSVHLDFGTFGHWHICISSFPLLSYKWGTHYRTNGGRIIVQMGDAHYQHLGDALSYRWGMLP